MCAYRYDAALVPGFILQQLAKEQLDGDLQAVSLFVRASGLARLTAELMPYGQEGAETLAEVLQAFWEPLIECIYRQSGFVAQLTGDGLVALFPGRRQPVYLRALAAAREVQHHTQDHSTFPTVFGNFAFRVRLSLGAGRAEWSITLPTEGIPPASRDGMGGIYLFHGQAIDRCLEGEPFADAGQIVLSNEVLAMLGDGVTAERAGGDEDYFRLHRVHCTLPTPKEAPRRAGRYARLAAAFYAPQVHQLEARGEFRRVVTVFIRLQADQGHERAGGILPHCLRLLRRHGGLLGRIARTSASEEGLSLLAFWGAPASSDKDVDRALSFLLDLQRAAPHVRFRAGAGCCLAFAGRVGSRLRAKYVCFGPGVDLAAQRMAAAPPGQVWLDKAIARHAGSHFDLAALGEVCLPGQEEAQPVYALRARRDLPVSPLFQGRLVGRERESAELASSVSPIFAGTGRFAGLIMIYGEPGAGKSRLLYEFRRQCAVALKPPLWLQGESDPAVDPSLRPFHRLLSAYFGLDAAGEEEAQRRARFAHRFDALLQHTANRALHQRLEHGRPALAALAGAKWAAELHYADAEQAVIALIQAECQRRPVILALEDAQWLDTDSATLVRELARTMTGYPLAILCTSNYLDGLGAPALHPSHGLPHQEVHLDGLPVEDARDYAAQVLGSRVSAEVAALLAERAAGNPLHIEQLALDLRERAAVRLHEGVYDLQQGAAVEAAASLGVLLAMRLSRLAPEVRAVVQAGAVLGHEFELPLLRVMLQAGDELAPWAQSAEEAQIWRRLGTEGCLFRHALLRDAAYGLLPAERRRELHRAAAQAIEVLHRGRPNYDAELAYHRAQASKRTSQGCC